MGCYRNQAIAIRWDGSQNCRPGPRSRCRSHRTRTKPRHFPNPDRREYSQENSDQAVAHVPGWRPALWVPQPLPFARKTRDMRRMHVAHAEGGRLTRPFCDAGRADNAEHEATAAVSNAMIMAAARRQVQIFHENQSAIRRFDIDPCCIKRRGVIVCGPDIVLTGEQVECAHHLRLRVAWLQRWR